MISNLLTDIALKLLSWATRLRARGSDAISAEGPVAHDDYARRWELYVHASSPHDTTYWVRREGDKVVATEVRSGISGEGATEMEAMANNRVAAMMIAVEAIDRGELKMRKPDRS